ncbi:MAG: lysine--tRNA ligase [Deltaproteobacteria bacterium]|nr:lysine--tRNA ligase [Deltaproteobacteria bacterium]
MTVDIREFSRDDSGLSRDDSVAVAPDEDREAAAPSGAQGPGTDSPAPTGGPSETEIPASCPQGFLDGLPPLIRDLSVKSIRRREEGARLYPNTFRPEHSTAEVRAEFGDCTNDVLAERKPERKLAGRIMACRAHGKSVFFTVQDPEGKIQLYARRDQLPREIWDLVTGLDIGDIVGVAGTVFRTRTGELTLNVTGMELVTKSLWPLPEKFHEMDVEMRYRRRYVDLIMNEQVRRVFAVRSKTMDYLRKFMGSKGFLEVETPMMHPIPGGANALPFVTRHNALKMDLYLRVAPELYLKRLLVGGMGRVFEINRNFRNEGISVKHNPEFTMMEFYQSYADYRMLMELTEEMFSGLAMEVAGTTSITYQGERTSFRAPFRRISWKDALVQIGGAPPEAAWSSDAAAAYLKVLDPADETRPGAGLCELQELIFDLAVEKKLVNPTFVTNYPTEMSPLARRNEADPSLTDRFELFICGREIANAFSELNDPVDQYARFAEQAAKREAGDQEGMYLDRDYVRALMYGMPPAAGEGVGVDRLVMLLTDSASIRDVILFPQMRPESL